MEKGNEKSRILIADDNEPNVELLEAYLAGLDVDTAIAVDGQDTLNKVASFKPHLILLDIMMPKLSGFEVCKKLKSDAATSHIMILMVTALNELGDIERAVTTFARGGNDGLIFPLSPLAAIHRDLIITLVARHRLPAVYPYRYFAGAGGLISYGPVLVDSFRRAAGYVDRILKGENPADLPVQAPVKYELAVNLKTAKALGLTIPDKLLALADEVIE